MTLQSFIDDFRTSVDTEQPNALADLRGDTRFQEHPAWDSLAMISLITFLSEKYRCEVEMTELKSCATVEEVYEVVVSRRGVVRT